MKVYFAPNSRAERTVWLLNELGLDYELERFELGDRAMRAPEYLAINPNGRVPTLDDGDVQISESTAIAQYIIALYGEGRLAPHVSSPDFPVYLQWMHYAEGMIMAPMGTIVVETILLPPERRNANNANRAMKLMSRTLTAVENHMEGRKYLAGDFSAADTITGRACMMAANLGAEMSDKPHLEAYIKRLIAHPALQAALNA